MRILTLLLHDERFSGWTMKDKLTRRHFSLQYLRFCRHKSWEPALYTFHQEAKVQQTYQLADGEAVKVFPVKFRFPPFQRFGNDHNPTAIKEEMMRDRPDLVHFHNYYLFSFPYTAALIKKRLKKPLIAQLHGYYNSCMRKAFYIPSLLALKKADRIVYSYQPEEALYKKLRVAQETVKVPVPGVDPQLFNRRRRTDTKRLLYVGRLPEPETAYGEKSPFFLLRLMRELLKLKKDVNLDVVGDGPGLYCCRSLADELKLADRVAFHGYVQYSDLPKYYQASALTFSPLRVYDVDGWFDGAIQESLACGTPVAALKSSPKRPLRGTFGFLLSNNVKKAAEEASALLQAPEDMEQVAQKGSEFVHQNCTCAKVASRLHETWEGVARA